jgi:NADPH:quinone reductase-like Zn-dependent oxidoreductase
MTACSCDLTTLFAFVGGIVLLKILFTILHSIYALFFRSAKDLSRYGKWAVVTGATDGIGKAFAAELAKQKLNIVLISRTQSKLDEVKKTLEDQYKVQVETVSVDFSKLDDAAKKRVQDSLASKDGQFQFDLFIFIFIFGGRGGGRSMPASKNEIYIFFSRKKKI